MEWQTGNWLFLEFKTEKTGKPQILPDFRENRLQSGKHNVILVNCE